MNTLIIGGSKSGKSMRGQELAEKMAKQLHAPKYYIAVMTPHDHEDIKRVEEHRNARKGLGYQTIEEPYNLLNILNANCNKEGVYLIDSLTALLSNVMFKDGEVNKNAGKELLRQLDEWLTTVPNIIIISDNIFSDAMIYDEMTELYRSELGMLHCELAKTCSRVEEVSAGIAKRWK